MEMAGIAGPRELPAYVTAIMAAGAAAHSFDSQRERTLAM
jgi:hypothetical protein